MELSQEEKDRIVAEEKLRMETRKEFFKDHFGGMGWRGGWGHHSYYGHGCHRGFGFVKGLLLAAVIFGIFHLWHHPCGPYYGYACPPAAQAPMPQTPPKN